MLNWHLIERKNMESKILVDTNVLLDYFLTREPFFNDAKQIIEKCAEGKINACIAAHSVSNMFFIQCVDFIISGYGKKKDPNVVIIELKQWDKVETVEGQDALVETFTGGAVRKVVHPSYQAWSYAAMIYDYNQNVQMGNIVLHPCTYLHNYRKTNPEKLEQNQYKEYVEDAPIFGRG